MHIILLTFYLFVRFFLAYNIFVEIVIMNIFFLYEDDICYTYAGNQTVA